MIGATMPDSPQKQVGLTTLLSDTMVFAATSVAAYLVALAFESGYAKYFGYPTYLIDVGFGVALTAWVAILGFAVIVLMGFLSTAYFVPAGATIGLVRTTYPWLMFGA